MRPRLRPAAPVCSHLPLEDWIGVGGARFEGGRVDYTLTDQVVTRLRPRVPSDSRPGTRPGDPTARCRSPTRTGCSRSRSAASG